MGRHDIGHWEAESFLMDNTGSILVAFLAILASGALLWRTERKKAAVGRRFVECYNVAGHEV